MKGKERKGKERKGVELAVKSLAIKGLCGGSSEFKFSLTYVRTLVKEAKTIQDCISQVWIALSAFVSK